MAEENQEEREEEIYIAKEGDFELPRTEDRVPLINDKSDFAPEVIRIKIVLALPTEQTAVELYLLDHQRRPSSLTRRIASRLTSGTSYDLVPLLSDDWYTLTEKLSEQAQSLPHLILFPHHPQQNSLYLSTMYRPEEYFAEGRPRLRSALDACRIIAERKDNPKDFPWLYLFGAEMLPERTRWDHGVKGFFKTTDTGILAEALKEKAYEALHWEVEQVRRKNFGSSWRRE